ncbi:MAG TPA: beta-galactosidase, partial [Candidatus Aquilonibacter sp.]|nr:beta-galactosidase [Candidatus Aquilonibacter sp.]
MHLCLMLFALLWSGWNTSAVTLDRGTPVFTVDHKPFFVYGAAFFYERTPRDEWRRDLESYRAMGINTIDLYIIWNWHAPNEHTLDFDGRTNPRRDLHALFSLIHELGFKVIVRPGPVIRNEWRNGGYPDWLLRRPEYNMPLHDILEGRYPATATLQNQHADAAANEWLHNGTHLRYASAWLKAVLRDIEPWSSDVIAIALDDDQGAYLDNDTYPAPHWHRYIDWLKSVVTSVVGNRVPLFINTYQMKVTASSPVWAWGNWYQSDAYRIGDHDIAQLMFSTGLLQTQNHLPLMTSEFQAGWLQGADEVTPRAAAPENTTIALHEMLQQGVHGVVNFPVQDTLNPAGYEAPWANWFYAWDAALTLQGTPSARYGPTAAFGSLVETYGSTLATLTPRIDLSIAWLGSAYDPSLMTNERYAALADATIAAQQRCRALALTCSLVDLHFADRATLRSIHALVVPAVPGPLAFEPATAQALAWLRSRIHVGPTVDALARYVHSSTGGTRDAALLESPGGRVKLLDVFNDGAAPRVVRGVTIPARGAVDIPLPPTRRASVATPPAPTATAIPITATSFVPDASGFEPVPPRTARAYEADVYRDGSHTFVLDNGRVRAIVSADAGARAFVFEDLATGRNIFTPIGAVRDDVATPLPLSPRDYIGKYTHPFPAGTFNRSYTCTVQTGTNADVLCSYTARDLTTKPVHFDKEFVLAPNSRELRVRVHADADARSISAVV